eukprot:2312711-Rhodomonas_salina.1
MPQGRWCTTPPHVPHSRLGVAVPSLRVACMRPLCPVPRSCLRVAGMRPLPSSPILPFSGLRA